MSPVPQDRNDSAVYLVLSILEGHGFGFLRSPVLIVAGTCGIFLETELVPPSPDPIFHVDLVWETNKRSLRRFRASNTPIKLECFTVDAYKKKSCIGSILLNIKTAQVVSNISETKVIERWHKLIGVPPDAKALQPELLLSLKIQETVSMPQPSPSSVQPREDPAKEQLKSPRQSPATIKDTNLQTTSSFFTEESAFPFYNSMDQYIQIGQENSTFSLFLLTLTVGDMMGVGMLISGMKPGSTLLNTEDFQVAFTIMNQNFSSKMFACADGGKIFNVKETIVARIRSSLSALYFYFHENPSIPVQLLWHGEEVAAAELHLRSLVPTDNIQSFSHEFRGESTCTQHCLWVSSRSGSIPTQNGAQPFVEIHSKLQLVNQNALPPKIIPSTSNKASPKSPSVQAYESVGDPVSSRSESRQSQDTFILSAQTGPKWVPVAPNPIEAEPSVLNKGSGDSSYFEDVMQMNHPNNRNCACTLSIKLSKLVLKYPLQSCRIRFMFECSQKPILTSDLSDIFIDNSLVPIGLSGICAKMSLPLDQIGKKCTIEVTLSEVCADPTVTQPLAFSNIDVNLVDLCVKRECSITSPLTYSRNLQDIGVLHGQLLMEESDRNTLQGIVSHDIVQSNLHPSADSSSKKNVKFLTASGMSSRSESTAAFITKENVTGLWHPQSNKLRIISSPSHPPPTIVQPAPAMLSSPTTVSQPSCAHSRAVPPAPLDTATAFRIVEELEDWKEKQQELFHAELKQKEVDHLSHISEELTEKRRELESLLSDKITQCKALLQSVSNAREDLRDRLKNCQQREQELHKEKEELEHQYNMKFQELTLAARRLDEGAKLKISLAELKSSKLEERLTSLESENESLRQQLRQKVLPSTLCGESHTCGMSHNQVTKLLSQVNQLEEKLQSSLQSKAYFKEQWGRAVREMNQARSQYSQTSDNRGIDFILGKEEAELQHDKKALEELRKELASYNGTQTPLL